MLLAWFLLIIMLETLGFLQDKLIIKIIQYVIIVIVIIIILIIVIVIIRRMLHVQTCILTALRFRFQKKAS